MDRLYSRRDILKIGAGTLGAMFMPGILKEAGGKFVDGKFVDDPNDPIDYTKDMSLSGSQLSLITTGLIKLKKKNIDIDKPLIPDNISKRVWEGMEYYEKHNLNVIDNGPIEIETDPNNAALWVATDSEITPAICPYLAIADMDGDGKGEEIKALYNIQVLQNDEEYIKEIEDHVKMLPKGFFKGVDKKILKDLELNRGFPDCAVNLYDWVYAENPDKLNNKQKIWYDLGPDEWEFIPGVLIHYEDFLGKAVREFGLTRMGKDVYETPSPGGTRENGKGTEKPTEPEPRKIDGYTGEEGLGGILGGAGVLTIGKLYDKYVSRKKNI